MHWRMISAIAVTRDLTRSSAEGFDECQGIENLKAQYVQMDEKES
jgi:hypothetical protein